jgi:hypothetical protein
MRVAYQLSEMSHTDSTPERVVAEKKKKIEVVKTEGGDQESGVRGGKAGGGGSSKAGSESVPNSDAADEVCVLRLLNPEFWSLQRKSCRSWHPPTELADRSLVSASRYTVSDARYTVSV